MWGVYIKINFKKEPREYLYNKPMLVVQLDTQI